MYLDEMICVIMTRTCETVVVLPSSLLTIGAECLTVDHIKYLSASMQTIICGPNKWYATSTVE